MPIQMKALRRIYVQSERKEYEPGQTFVVHDDSEADRYIRRSKAERSDGKHAIEQPRRVAPAPAVGDDLSSLRTRYQEVAGKRPFHGWDAAALKVKIGEYSTRHLTAQK